MDSRLAHPPNRHHGLQPLLDCLLCMEADDVVGYLRIGGELTGGSCICLRLASEARRQLGGITLRQEPDPR